MTGPGRRKSLTDLTADLGPAPELASHPPATVHQVSTDTAASNGQAPAGEPPTAPAKTRRTRASSAAAKPGKPAKPARPTARDLLGPARRTIAREAIKADVPADLGLIRRLHSYRLDHGIDIRDQVALALDEWLTREGY